MHSDLKIVDPIWTTAYITRNHGYMIYDTLFAMDEEGVIRPQMVDKYDERRSSSPVAWFCAERRSRMSRNTALMTMVVAALVSSILAADAHDSWISRGGYRNPAGEWCCGATDCEAHEQIATTGAGWVVGGSELIPYSEAAPSPDGKLWICRRPDKSRRCVFAPPPNS